MIRLNVPSIDQSDLDAVSEVLRTGMLVQGARVKAFEEALQPHTGAPHVVAVSNGTAALHLALLALDVQPGDLVLVTAYSWISTANAVEFCGAQPAFVDIDRRTYNMSPGALEVELKRLMAVASTARRVKAILPIDAFGQMADLPSILALGEKYGVPVVEDAACSLGASLNGKRAGEMALATFSLHPRKAITTGEGGFLTTADERVAWKLRALRNHGLNPAAATPDFVMPGYNYRLTEFQAAMGLTQLAKMDRLIAARRRLAARYAELLAGSALTVPFVPEGHAPVFQSYVCLLPAGAAPRRAALIASLREAGVETQIGTWHMPLTTYFRTRYGYRAGDFPDTDEVFARAFSLPLYEGLTDEDQRRVVAAVLERLQ